MWIVRIETDTGKGIEGLSLVTLPLQIGRKYRIGRGPMRDKADNIKNDIVLQHKSVSRSLATVEVGNWPMVDDETDELDYSASTLTFHNELFNAQPKTSHQSTSEPATGQPAPSKKSMRVLKPHKKTPRGSTNEADYSIENEWKTFEISSGTQVHAATAVKMIFEWVPCVFLRVKNPTSAEASASKALEQYGVIVHTKNVLPGVTTHVIVPTIEPNHACYTAVSSALHLVTPAYIIALLDALKSSKAALEADRLEDLLVPDCDEFLPVISKDVDGVRSKKDWWKAQPERRTIWTGRTIAALIDREPAPEIGYLQHGGARVISIDIDKKFLHGAEDLPKRLSKPVEEAKRWFRTAQSDGNIPADADEAEAIVVAARTTALDRYDGMTEEKDQDICIIRPLTELGLNFQYIDLWYLALTKSDWHDFAAGNEESSGQGSASQSRSSGASQGRFQLQATEASQIPSVPAASAAGGTFIPSTHPEEQDIVEPEEPVAPKRLLKRRAGRAAAETAMFDPFADDSRAEEPVSKRPKLGPPEADAAEPEQSVATSILDDHPINGQSRTKLRRRGKAAEDADMMSLLFGVDESTPSADTSDPLEKYRDIYNMGREGAASMDMDGGGTSQAPSVGGGPNEEDFVQMSLYKQKQEKAERIQRESESQNQLRQQHAVDSPVKNPLGKGTAKTSADAARAPGLDVEDEDEEMPKVPEEPNKDGDGSVRAPVLRKTGMDKDAAFLKIVAKKKSKDKPENELDRDFNNLKIAKNAGPQAVLGNEADIYDLATLGDMTTTGNFTRITRIEVYKKAQPAPTEAVPDFAGRPNFKKFKKQHIIRRQPVPLGLPPAADFGLGTGYFFSASDNVRVAPTNQSQAGASQSQSQATVPASQAVAIPKPLVKGKRKLLAADSDDEDLLVASPIGKRSRAGSQASQANAPAERRTRATPVPAKASSPASKTKATRKRKASSPQPSVGTVVLDSEDDAGPAKRTRRGTSVGTVASIGDSDLVDLDLMKGRSGRGSNTASGTGPARTRKRLLVVDEDDDDDLVVINRRKRH